MTERPGLLGAARGQQWRVDVESVDMTVPLAAPRPLTIVTSEDLELKYPPLADCGRYDQLRGLHAAA